MKFFLFTILFLFTSVAFACNENEALPGIEVKAVPHSNLIRIEVRVPNKFSNFKLSNASFNIGENHIPMSRGYEENGTHMYYLVGEKEFLMAAKVDISYTGIDSLCVHSEEIGLKKAIENCSDCDEDI